MSSPEYADRNIDPLSREGIETEQAEDGAVNGLYAGDVGELALDTRRALVQLLSGPSLEGRHTNLWPALLRDEAIIRRRLADLFLELVIDHDNQVAFTRQADAGGLEVPLLLRRSRLTFIDSVMLLYLRLRLTQAESQGERAVIAKEEIFDYLSPYEQTGNTDRAGFGKKVSASIEKYKDRSILQKIRGSDDRFEISPTLKLLFSAEEIQSLTELYKGMAKNGQEPDEDEPGLNGGEEL